MQPRQSVIELFSTFVQFQSDSFGGWATDARLRRSIQSQLGQQSQLSDAFWSSYWHKVWQQKQAHQALGHLSAYLQEPCYWSAYKAMAYLTRSRYRLSDCFQAAIADVPKILKARDPDHPGSLKTYASQAFSNIIRDFLRQTREIDLCSDWGLLLKISRKRLMESLENAGLNAEEIERLVVAWSCFEAIYLPTKSPKLRQLAAPDRETWAAIAHRYNQLQKSEVTPEIIEKWLMSCVRRVRSYLYPAVSSLNAPKLGEDSKEVQEDLPDPNQESLMAELIAEEEIQERQKQRVNINEVLETAIAQFDSASQELLQLYYQKSLTQQEIAKQLGVQQYTVSRKLSKIRETLLLTLTRWSQETLHIVPSSDVIKQISTMLEEWLTQKMQG